MIWNKDQKKQEVKNSLKKLQTFVFLSVCIQTWNFLQCALTFDVLVDNALQPIQPLHDLPRFPFTVLLQLSLRLAAALCNFGTAVRHIVGDPADVQEAHDVGHAAQDHACRHQSFSSPRAEHRDIPPWASCSRRAQAGRLRSRRTREMCPKVTTAMRCCGVSPPLRSQVPAEALLKSSRGFKFSPVFKTIFVI